MAVDPLSALFTASFGLGTYNEYQSGKAKARDYKNIAMSYEREAQAVQEEALEEMRQMNQEGRAIEGEQVVKAAGAGVLVGGSVTTQVGRIRRKLMNERKLLGMRTSRQMSALGAEAGRYRYAAREQKRAAKWDLYSNLLGGGFRLGKYNIGRGKNWWDIRR